MKFIKPITIVQGNGKLVSTTATEAVAAYAAGTTYALGQQVYVAADMRVYESLQAGNIGHTPATSPTWWLDVGPMNQWAMFDGEISTATTAASSLTVVLDVGPVNSLALFGLVGDTLTLTMTDGPGGATIYSRTVNLDGTLISDWYQYYFEPDVQMGELFLSDLPTYWAARLTITLTSTGSVACAHCSVGTGYWIGDAKYGAGLGIDDYSRVETDEFGITTLVRRRSAKTLDVAVMLPNVQINKVFNLLDGMRATPCVWSLVDSDPDGVYAPFLVFAVYRKARVEIAYPRESLLSLELKGMT